MRTKSGTKEGDQKENSAVMRRHRLLTVIQSEARVNNDESSTNTIFSLQLPLRNSSAIKLPLPLPNITDWGTAKLLLAIGAENLLKVLNLIMLERNVLVVGADSGDVSVASCALCSLLAPYNWAGTFIPVLPNNMLDFLSSPVPFICGMSMKRGEANRVLNDGGVREAINSGLSVIDLDARYLAVTLEPGIEEVLPLSTENEGMKRLLSLHSRLATTQNSMLTSDLKEFINAGSSSRDLATVNSVKNIVENYLTTLGGSCATTRNAWQRYGMINRATDCFEFYPDWYDC